MLTGLHHVGYVVPDLDRAISFYRDTLGLQLDRRGDAGPGMGFEVAVFRLGDGATGIELIKPTTDSGPFADFLRANPAGGLHHVAYTAGPLTEAAERVKQCGLQLGALTAGGPIDTAAGWRIVNVEASGTQGLLTQLGEQ
ncbi:MAG TPA: VOC family protein [Chloroflexota bacterium]|jgi:methylmalonyl-CoA/ethylmalonyl-CoA epimerase|nr:VOC family protein [Chloroflexota bacterium]